MLGELGAGKASSNIRQTAIEDLVESIGWSALAAEHEFDVARLVCLSPRSRSASTALAADSPKDHSLDYDT